MLSNQENFNANSSIGFNKIDQVDGLETFKENLEKYFFSQIVIRDVSTELSATKLVLELNCNFSLHELVHHLNIGTWGSSENTKKSFDNILNTLRQANNFQIELEEFSINLKDTSIIINKIFADSIPQQLEDILQAIVKNHLYFTKGLTEVPYEIYVPVFEEGLPENDKTLINIKSGNNNVKDYFNYWGVYYYTEDDALIYDLKTTSIISGELQMLNY